MFSTPLMVWMMVVFTDSDESRRPPFGWESGARKPYQGAPPIQKMGTCIAGNVFLTQFSFSFVVEFRNGYSVY